MEKTICVQGVIFKRITESSFKKLDLSNILFFIISQSGVFDRCGIIYVFTETESFFMEKQDYKDGFIDELLLMVPNWNLVNVYFCDFLVIKPAIYDSFVRELCARNLRYFWFETAIDVYDSRYKCC